VLVERQSNTTLIAGIVLLCVAICLRRLIFWYGQRCSIIPISPWEQLTHGGILLFSSPPGGNPERNFPAA
jgi:hypothetical protein